MLGTILKGLGGGAMRSVYPPIMENALLTFEVPYILTVSASAIAGDTQLEVVSNVADLILPAQTVINFGDVPITLNCKAIITSEPQMINILPLPNDLLLGSRSDQPSQSGRSVHKISFPVKAWLKEARVPQVGAEMPLDVGSIYLKGRAIEPSALPKPVKAIDFARLKLRQGQQTTHEGVFRLLPNSGSVLLVEPITGDRIQGIFTGEAA
jgi:hypothetical protein